MLKLDLFSRDHRYIPDGQGNEMREANGEKVFWSRGIGWVLASIPRILQYMPDDYHERDRYITLFKQLARSILDYQHEDGFWRTSLLDPDNFPAPESSATALFLLWTCMGNKSG
ncbi:gycosyl hydrolase [Proteus mirabilis]|uniref:Gycosyl hydrolase n=1 Tax=Proteus mirabilis TaxID=584 RepID=A0A2X2BFF2_PROMI|nr:gycosyl hydrolase [Proteus mirabilis]